MNNTLSPSDYAVGQWVVAMSSPGTPCNCNSANASGHPCRVQITKVGRTKVHGFMSGDTERPTAMAIPGLSDHGLLAYPLDEAKRLYGEALRSRGHPRADALVDSL